ncbi:response regulator [Mucilaginibacter polytrichastri]|uniref:response regulator n=1 Tax=Mucilaginibacter polytrichastri TaxID=1302689 RepID=UPI000943E18E|nr:response regulator [Mucilaginibacter polytrichastri]
MKILVIEDNKDILEIINIILSDDGYEVVSHRDGSCIDHLKDINPGLIITDELLPGTKGSELCHRLKESEEFKHIPVVLMSASQALENIAIKCRADAYMAKPFDMDALTELVKDLLSKQQSDSVFEV